VDDIEDYTGEDAVRCGEETSDGLHGDEEEEMEDQDRLAYKLDDKMRRVKKKMGSEPKVVCDLSHNCHRWIDAVELHCE
jgi:hypothetical protein